MLNTIFYYLTLSLLFLLQFAYFSYGTSYFENPKVYAAEIVIFCLLLVSILKGDYLIAKNKRPLLVVFSGIILLSLYHLTFLQTDYTFWGNEFRMQGVLLLWFLLLFSYLSAGTVIKKISPYFLIFILLCQLFLSFHVDSGSLERAVGSVGEPNSLAGIMIVMWPFLYFSMTKKRFGLLAVLGSVLIVGVVLIISGSRSGLVAFSLQLIFLFGITVVHWPLKRVVVLSLFLFVCSLALPILEKGSEYENRAEVWQAAAVAGLSHPLLGNGFGNEEFALNTASIKLNNHLQGYYVDSAHNIFLDWWVQGGIVGLSILLFLIGNTVKYFITTNAIRNLTIFFGLLVVLSFNPVSVILLIYLWWLIGQSV